ncbi:hypothetical protein [Pedobacter sp. UC225_65]|uniref:hypothetical protein n=1 Tax=Pedobacter sp. UC225_65 TaxID=3350173 RepID=UPI00366FEBC8
MKLRLTPLNIVTALGIAFLAVSFFQPKTTSVGHVQMGTFYQLIFAALIVVTIISDLIFRFTLKELKRIWLVEMVFIILTIILFLILQK